MHPTLTPRETLWFSAQLKLPMTQGNKKAKVNSLVEEVRVIPLSATIASVHGLTLH